jgi:hypothetical protein
MEHPEIIKEIEGYRIKLEEAKDARKILEDENKVLNDKIERMKKEHLRNESFSDH